MFQLGKIRISFLLMVFFLALFYAGYSQPESDFAYYKLDEKNRVKLTRKSASLFARLALNCIQREYPNKVFPRNPDTLTATPLSQLHPVFFGCYDWHSSVHSHWLLVRILKIAPDLAENEAIREKLNENLTIENIRGECRYFEDPSNRSFERMYGWAWLLKLSEELYNWNDKDARKWRKNLQPLTDLIVARYLEYLPKQAYSNNTGVHSNTAFALSFAYDYAAATGADSLKELVIHKGKAYFLADSNCPAYWEPGIEDFLSPCLMKAELMSKILPREDFVKWFDRFMPGLGYGDQNMLIYPAEAPDRADEKGVHLDGLNLSRAWCMLQIAKSLDKDHPDRNILFNAAHRHLQTTLPHVASGEYVGEHWLASFAIYALSFDY